jgi:hypothetical protein
MWTQAWQSSMIPVVKGSKVVMPAFPALERVIVDAEKVRRGEADGTETELARSLAAAFEDCRRVTEKMYPGDEEERRQEDNKGHWLHLTEGRITGLIHMPPRALLLGVHETAACRRRFEYSCGFPPRAPSPWSSDADRGAARPQGTPGGKERSFPEML